MFIDSDLLHLSFECQDKLKLIVNGVNVKEFTTTFNPVSFSLTAQTDKTTIEYLTTEMR